MLAAPSGLLAVVRAVTGMARQSVVVLAVAVPFRPSARLASPLAQPFTFLLALAVLGVVLAAFPTLAAPAAILG